MYGCADYGFFKAPFDLLQKPYQSFVKMQKDWALETHPQIIWLTRLFVAFEAIERVRLKKFQVLMIL
ncbi:MAG TPA: hypothetical protein DCF96_08345 [Rhodobacteraceae bacterium]|nr:hypothetical protein [Paracoccaceae bacterium]